MRLGSGKLPAEDMGLELLTLVAVLTLGLLTPGPDFLVVLRNSVGTSRIQAFGAVAGVTAGLFVQMTAITIGFTVITPPVLRLVQLAGAVFLAWIGLRSLRRSPGAGEPPPPSAAAGRSAFLEGLACNLANPKAFLFYVSMFAQVLTPGASPAWRIGLPVIFVTHGAVLWTLVVLAVQSPLVARPLVRAQRWLPRVFGLVLLAFAGWMAWQAW